MIDKPEVLGLRRVVRAALIERERLADKRRDEQSEPERQKTSGYIWLWDRVILAGTHGLVNLPEDAADRRELVSEAHRAIDVIFRAHTDAH